MKAGGEVPDPSADWQGPGQRRRKRFCWSDLLWSLIFPERNQRIMPTVPGLVLIGLALGIGSAAYNTASNILFITLSLLLACLILSGVMSWFNLREVCWRLLLQPPLRAGQETPVTLELWNRKRLLPTYGLWFDLSARPAPVGPQRAESTVTATSADIRAAFARAEQAAARATLHLRDRLDPGGQARLDWLFTPARRGIVRVELTSVGSLFPFGFLRKSHGTLLRREVIVWPAPVEYRFLRTAAALRQSDGERVTRPGSGNDLLALRRYQTGDSHRLIHWKASARMRQLLVRQFAAESAEGFSLWLETPAAVWIARGAIRAPLPPGGDAGGGFVHRRPAQLRGGERRGADRRPPRAGFGVVPRPGGAAGIQGGPAARPRGRVGRPVSGVPEPPQHHHLRPGGQPGRGRLHRWRKNGHSLVSTSCTSSGGCSAASWSWFRSGPCSTSTSTSGCWRASPLPPCSRSWCAPNCRRICRGWRTGSRFRSSWFFSRGISTRPARCCRR